jgi:hypothetical protein
MQRLISKHPDGINGFKGQVRETQGASHSKYAVFENRLQEMNKPLLREVSLT